MAEKSTRLIAPWGGARPPAGGEPSTDPIDRAYLARFTLGNAALEREVLELFSTQMPLYLDRLRTGATSKEWKDATHTIKGSAAAVGARRVARMAELAEKLDVASPAALSEGYRENAVTAVAAAIDEACRHIERLFPKT